MSGLTRGEPIALRRGLLLALSRQRSHILDFPRHAKFFSLPFSLNLDVNFQKINMERSAL